MTRNFQMYFNYAKNRLSQKLKTHSKYIKIKAILFFCWISFHSRNTIVHIHKKNSLYCCGNSMKMVLETRNLQISLNRIVCFFPVFFSILNRRRGHHHLCVCISVYMMRILGHALIENKYRNITRVAPFKMMVLTRAFRFVDLFIVCVRVAFGLINFVLRFQCTCCRIRFINKTNMFQRWPSINLGHYNRFSTIDLDFTIFPYKVIDRL